VERCLAVDAENELLKHRIDELQKENEVLKKELECDCQALNKWRLSCIEYEEKVKILEAQMEIVQLIFGGKNHG
jgi:hypothetical protein